MTEQLQAKCKFYKAWTGQCGEKCLDGDYCERHSITKCCSCGNQATHECSETFMLVCGAPLCDNCEHIQETTPESWFTHVKKER